VWCAQSAADLVLRTLTPFNYCVIDEVTLCCAAAVRRPTAPSLTRGLAMGAG
jgi:hypothetical protein